MCGRYRVVKEKANVAVGPVEYCGQEMCVLCDHLCLRARIGSNDTLRTLDLSWNSIRLKGATAVAKGLQVRWSTSHDFKQFTCCLVRVLRTN